MARTPPEAHVRVAIATANFWPEQTGISQTVTEMAAFFAANGLDVRVATSMPYYPQWRIHDAYRGKLYLAERMGDVRVWRSWHLVSPAPGTVTRLLQEWSMSLMAVPTLFRALKGADVAYVVSPSLLFAFSACVVARLLRIRVVLVIKDVMPDAAIELGMLNNPLLVMLSRWLARRCYGMASEIQTLGAGMQRRIARDGADITNVRIVPDTIDVRELAPPPPDTNVFRRDFVPAGTFAVLHTGNMGRKQDLGLLLRAAHLLAEDPGVHFCVFGDGAEKAAFLRQRDALKLANVSHHPLQPRWMLPHMLAGADAVLVSQLPQVTDLVVPSKLVTALGAGAMVIAACDAESETAALVRASGGGMVVAPSDEHALVAAIARIRSGGVDTTACRASGRAYAAARFDREVVYGDEVKRLTRLSASG